MLRRTPEKPRFRLDVPKQPQHWSAPIREDATTKHKRPAFRVGSEETARWSVRSWWMRVKRLPLPRLPFKLAPFTWASLTLAQRRQRLRLIAIASGALVIIVAIVGALLYNTLSHQALISSSGNSSAITGGGPHANHLYSTAPFDSLQVHTATNAGQSPAIQASSAFLFDPQRGWIFYQKDSDTSQSAASLTKIMTLLLAINSGSLDQPVTIGPDAAALVNSNNSYMGVSEGEQLTLRQLLYGLMLPGGNDAALAIADATSGNGPAFVAAMNRYVMQLGLRHTHFVSADGVSNANISSARDLAILTAIAIQQPGVAQITATRQLTIPQTASHKEFNLTNTNDLLPGASSAYAGVNGFKTGYTSSAGYCMAFTAQKDGHLLVGVILGDSSDQARVSDARALLDWGFAQES